MTKKKRNPLWNGKNSKKPPIRFLAYSADAMSRRLYLNVLSFFLNDPRTYPENPTKSRIS